LLAAPGTSPLAELPLAQTRFYGREADIAHLAALLRPPHREHASGKSEPGEQRVRLLSLVGPGGAGKSRLALEAAWHLAEPWRGALRWVALADVTTEAGLGEAVLDALAPASATGRSRGGAPDVGRAGSNAAAAREQSAAAVAREVRGRPTLLLLDNFEQLVPHAVPLLEAWLARVPSLSIVATSRRRLGAHGEHEWPVRPLPTPPEVIQPLQVQVLERGEEQGAGRDGDAVERAMEWASVRLWVDRARLSRSEFRLTPSNVRAVEALCCRLDGLPLALELSAARASVLSPSQMLARLEPRLRMKSQRPGQPERQRSLHASLEWSYRLLSPEAAACFRRLGVFSGGCSLEAAEAVCWVGEDRDGEIVECLRELRDCSLLEADAGEGADEGAGGDAEMRFSLLETVREFALEKLEGAGEADHAWRRHAVFFCSLCESERAHAQAAESERRLGTLRRLQREHANLHAAIAWSLDHDIVLGLHLAEVADFYIPFRASDLHAEAEQAIERAEKSGVVLPPHLLSAFWGVAALGAWRRGDYPHGRRLATRRLELMRSIRSPGSAHDTLEMAWAIFHMADCASGQGDRQATALFEEALALFRSLDTSAPSMRLPLGWTLNKLGQCAFWGGDLERAYEMYRQSGEVFAGCGDRDGVASSLAQRADAARAMGRLDHAERLMDHAERIERELRDERSHPWRRLQRGRIEMARSRQNTAREALVLAGRGFIERDELPGVLRCLLALALLAAQHGQHRHAAILLGAEEAQRQAHRLIIHADWRDEHQAVRQLVQDALDEDSWAEASAHGHALSPEAAMALA
jgi:predicted ATPase